LTLPTNTTMPLVRAYQLIQKLHYAIRPVCRDLYTTCALSVYSMTLSYLEDNPKMASRPKHVVV